MKKSILLIGIAATVFCQQACYEDKGDYDYIPANAVTITMPSALNANMGDTLYYTPVIAFANPADTTGFEYWWEYMGLNRTLDHREVICEGRELRFLPRLLNAQVVQFCVKESRSGTITYATMIVNGGSVYTKGWLILHEDGGESKLSYVRPDRSVPGDVTSGRVYVPYIDLYGRIFPGESLGSGPIAVRQIFHMQGGTIFYVIQENGSVCLNGVSYASEISLAKEFIGGAPAGFAPRDYFQGGFSSMVLNADGKVYYRCPYYGNNTPFFTYSFANFPMEYQGQMLKIDRIIPGMADRTFYFAVYDKENRRFLWAYAGSEAGGGTLMPATINPATFSPYLDYNDVGDAEILFTTFHNHRAQGWGGTASNLTLYAKSGDVFIQKCDGYNEDMYNVVTSQYVTITLHDVFSGKAYLSPDTKYYQLQMRNYLFFATGNQLYWYDHSTGTSRLFHTFPAGAKVVDMDSNPQESELGVVLSSGKFITLHIEDNRLMLNDKQIYELDIPGKIVDLEYKFPSSSAYMNRASNPNNWD